MKDFMDKDFMLYNDTAKHLYHDYCEDLPLIDYHCHISPKEIYEDRRFEGLDQIWLGGRQPDGTFFGDHYKWRVMRSNGIPEEYITGDKPGVERITKFAEALQMAIGNPMYHWSNLELHRYFGFDSYLNPDNAEEVFNMCKEKLQNDPNLTVRGLLRQSHVAMVGTTDDPIDSLEWHKKLAEDPTCPCKVYPSFRPDKAINIQKPGFAQYIGKLSAVVGRELKTTQDVCDALVERLEFFASMGCRASDHGLDYIPYLEGTDEQADAAFQKVMAGGTVNKEETDIYQTKVLVALGKAYARLNIAMQLHYSCIRNINARMFKIFGPDTGFDAIAQTTCVDSIAALLSKLDETDECPKTILYSLNGVDDDAIGTLLGCFQTPEVPGKIQMGSAWWFEDHRVGMENQMISLANLGLLGNFIGMLTDSRSFLSYTRHDYFRRIMCNLIGTWVENGEYPNDEAALKKIVQGICCYNAARYFNVEL